MALRPAAQDAQATVSSLEDRIKALQQSHEEAMRKKDIVHVMREVVSAVAA